MDHHDEAVAGIAATVRQLYDRKEAFRIYHGSTHGTRQSSLLQTEIVDISHLSHVLKVDRERNTALVEPSVPMDYLLRATLEHGLIPPVVMEFPGITVGESFAGAAGESSSFKHGLFDRTINWIEIVLANGDIVNASDTKDPELFSGAASSFGTLGIATLLELRLVEARTYVELVYFPVTSVSHAVEKIKEASYDLSNDYIDGILFARNHGVIMTGRLTDLHKDGPRIQQFSQPRDPWFYLHAKASSTGSTATTTEVIPLEDYLFRYDRGAFWTGAHAFKYFMAPFNRVTRWAFDSFMHAQFLFRAGHESGHGSRYIVQEFAVPAPTAQKFVGYVDETLGSYPLWLCPLRPKGQLPLHQRNPYSIPGGPMEKILINVRVWGPGPSTHDLLVKVNRKLEQRVRQLSGTKWLSALTYYTEAEFWDIYDRDWYDGLRAKYYATNLPTVHDIVRVDLRAQRKAISGIWAIWPLGGVWGVLRAALGSDFFRTPDPLSLRDFTPFFALVSIIFIFIAIVWMQRKEGLEMKIQHT
jgi:delta24-sterol reductase